MYMYGSLLIGDSIITKNISESEFNDAMKYLKMAADKGYVDAMIKYAINKIFKDGFNFCDPEIARYLRMGADHGDKKCKEMLSLNGINDENSIFLNQSAEDFKELADNGDVDAMLSYGKMLYAGEGIDQDKEEAAKYFKKAADLENSHAMFEYGKMLVNGDGIPEKKQEGIKYLSSSVANRNIELMYSYGQLRRKGEEIPVDKNAALRYIKLSSDQGYQPAMFAYGQMLLRGEGTPINKEEGIKCREQSTIANEKLMYEYGEMLRKGEDVPVDKEKAAKYFKNSSDLGEPLAMLSYGSMEYFGDGIPVNKKDGIRLIKLAAEKGIEDAKKLYEELNGSNSLDKVDVIDDELNNSIEKGNDDGNINSNSIRVNIYESPYDNGEINFMYIKNSTVSQQIRDDYLKEIQKYDFYKEIQTNLVHPDDPNCLYTFYHFFKNTNENNHILTRILKNYGINFLMPKWNYDIFFDEKIVPQNTLKLLLKQFKRINFIDGVNRNIFDGRQIATYIRVQKMNSIAPLFINERIQEILLAKQMVFDKIKYPLENDIIINEQFILKNEDDFDFILDEIKKFGINPINIERNRLYLYGNYFIKKLFEIFSFICFQNETDKMKALNHVNSIVYSNKKNILNYNLNLHYAKLTPSVYPKNVRDNLARIFQSFKGFQDIQKNVLSIENPIERTYVGFDSVKHLKKSYRKFFHCVDILKFDVNPTLFIKKKNLAYLIIKGNINVNIEEIIPQNLISDIQKDCTEFEGNKFNEMSSHFINATFIGFENKQKLNEAYNLLTNRRFIGISISKYHEFKTFLSGISDVPEEYLFYDSL